MVPPGIRASYDILIAHHPEVAFETFQWIKRLCIARQFPPQEAHTASGDGGSPDCSML
jgi:hypothetical protein